MARHQFFVTGTDTGVGKTTATVAMLQAARARGLSSLAMKPLASGCEMTADGLRNTDALALQAAMTATLPYRQINPIALAPAIAPHLAAREAGVLLSSDRLSGFVRGLMLQPADLLLVEGAGGWRVPLNDSELFSDVPRQLGLPVILVVALRLGCLNHALLTAEAIMRDGLCLAGWIANRPGELAMDYEQANLDYLRKRLPAPCLGVLPWQPESPDVWAKSVNLDAILS